MAPRRSASPAKVARSASPSAKRSSPAAAPAAAAPAPAPASSWSLPRGLSWQELLLLLLALALFCAGLDLRFARALREALRPFDTATVRLASLSDAQFQAGVMLVVYVVQYCVLGGLFEGTHPDGALSGSLSPQRLALRRKQVRSEFSTGVGSLAVTVACAVLWMWKVEPLLWTYGWFAATQDGGKGHELTPAMAVGGVLAYIAAFDTHFFVSHLRARASVRARARPSCRGHLTPSSPDETRSHTVEPLAAAREHLPLEQCTLLPPLVQGALGLCAVLRAPARERAAGSLRPLLRAVLLCVRRRRRPPALAHERALVRARACKSCSRSNAHTPRMQTTPPRRRTSLNSSRAPGAARAHGLPVLGLGLCGARRPRPRHPQPLLPPLDGPRPQVVSCCAGAARRGAALRGAEWRWKVGCLRSALPTSRLRRPLSRSPRPSPQLLQPRLPHALLGPRHGHALAR